MKRSMPTMATALVAFVIATGVIFAFLFRETGQSIHVSKPYAVSVVMPTSVALSPTSDVRAAGVKIGKVTDVALTSRGESKVTFELKSSFAPLTRDARVLVRTKTLLGETYLSVDPGTQKAGTIPDGGTVAAAQVDDAVQLDDILSVFDRKTRDRLRDNLRLSSATFGRRGADINRALGAAAPAARDTATVMSVLAGQRDDVHAVVRHTGRLLETLATRRDQLQELIRQGKGAADVLSARDERLAETVRALPALLAQTRVTARRLGTFSASSAPIVEHVTAAATDLAPTVRDLEPAARSARQMFDRVPRLVRAADPLLVRLRRLSTAAVPLVQNLRPLLDVLNPALAYLAPYSKEAASFFANVGAVNSISDANGNYIRVYPQIDVDSLALLNPEGRKLYDKLLDVTGLSQIKQLRTNHYPKPGTIGDPQPYDGVVPRVASRG